MFMAEKMLSYNFNVFPPPASPPLWVFVLPGCGWLYCIHRRHQSFLQLFSTAIIFLAESVLCSASSCSHGSHCCCAADGRECVPSSPGCFRAEGVKSRQPKEVQARLFNFSNSSKPPAFLHSYSIALPHAKWWSCSTHGGLDQTTNPSEK